MRWLLVTPYEKIPSSFCIENALFKLKIKFPIKTIATDVEGFICVYESQERILLLPAMIYECNNVDYYVIGMKPPKAFVAQRDKINSNFDATIYYCMDPLVGIHLSNMVSENPCIHDKEYIVSFHYGGYAAFDFVDLDVLRFRKVVICALPTRRGLLEAVEFEAMCLKAGASEVLIYPFPIIAYALSSGTGASFADPWERIMAREALYLKEVQQLSNVLPMISEKALTKKDCISWGKNVGVFKEELEEQGFEGDGEVEFYPIVIRPALEGASGADVLHDDSLLFDVSKIFTAGLLSLIWSATNSAKSLFALYIALLLVYGKRLLFFKSSKLCNVCILDGEMDKDILEKRLNPLHDKYNFTADSEFSVKFILNKSLPTSQKINLLSSSSQEKLLKWCVKENISVVVVDNLMALCGDVLSSVPKFNIMMAFFATLREHNIAVIVVNHSNKAGSIKGLSELEALSQNVFHLEKIHDENRHGAHCHLTVTKCKSVPELEYRPQEIFLPLRASEWENLSSEVVVPLNIDNDDKGQEYLQMTELELSPDEQRVMMHIRTAEIQSVTRKNVEELISCKEDKARSVLNSLQSKELIESFGAGPNTYYKLRKK